VAELQGLSCLALEEVSPPRMQIISSRSFGQMVSTLKELRKAVSTYAARAGEKLQADRWLCSAVHVFIQTNPFRQQDKQYNNGIVVPLTEATHDTRRLTTAALFGLQRIYRPGYQSKKAGVILMELQAETGRQASLFTKPDEGTDRLMLLLDRLNQEYGRSTIYLASCGIQQRWSTQFEMRTACYTTRWNEPPIAKS
jgi:DNA polymerase V